MRVALEWGGAQHLEAHDDSVHIPKPEVDEWLIPVWKCWHRLHLDRPYYGGGMGPMVPGRISWRMLRDWAEFHDMTAEDFDQLDACVRAMDDTYLEFQAAKAKAEANAPKKGGR